MCILTPLLGFSFSSQAAITAPKVHCQVELPSLSIQFYPRALKIHQNKFLPILNATLSTRLSTGHLDGFFRKPLNFLHLSESFFNPSQNPYWHHFIICSLSADLMAISSSFSQSEGQCTHRNTFGQLVWDCTPMCALPCCLSRLFISSMCQLRSWGEMRGVVLKKDNMD